jgi:hypothetical protein
MHSFLGYVIAGLVDVKLGSVVRELIVHVDVIVVKRRLFFAAATYPQGKHHRHATHEWNETHEHKHHVT